MQDFPFDQKTNLWKLPQTWDLRAFRLALGELSNLYLYVVNGSRKRQRRSFLLGSNKMGYPKIPKAILPNLFVI